MISTNFQKKKEDDFDIFHYHFSSGMNAYGLEKREEDSTAWHILIPDTKLDTYVLRSMEKDNILFTIFFLKYHFEEESMIHY